MVPQVRAGVHHHSNRDFMKWMNWRVSRVRNTSRRHTTAMFSSSGGSTGRATMSYPGSITWGSRNAPARFWRMKLLMVSSWLE